jgi:hypothetical protein
MERDNEIKKILEELNDNNNLESFNRSKRNFPLI